MRALQLRHRFLLACCAVACSAVAWCVVAVPSVWAEDSILGPIGATTPFVAAPEAPTLYRAAAVRSRCTAPQ